MIMENLFTLIDERVKKVMGSSAFVSSTPCIVTDIYENEMVHVKLLSNDTEYTVPNWSGSCLNIGERVSLFYRGIISNETCYIGASLNKDVNTNGYVYGEAYLGELQDENRNIAVIDFYNSSENILLGFDAVIQGDSETVSNGIISIYIDGVLKRYKPTFTTVLDGYTHCSFTLPYSISNDIHTIEIKCECENSILIDIESYVWGSVRLPIEPTDENDYIYRIDDNGVYIIKYIGTKRYIQTPLTLDGVPVKIIGKSAFMETNVKMVVIQEGIEEIE